ncbi:MAG TPA: hypothetical protein VGB16_04505 [candidate division Zixibacteria bacterium]
MDGDEGWVFWKQAKTDQMTTGFVSRFLSILGFKAPPCGGLLYFQQN